MAELEGGVDTAGELEQKVAQQGVVAREIGRQLEQYRSQPLPKRLCRAYEVVEAVLDAAQAGKVGDALRGLEREAEVRRRLCRPDLEHRTSRHRAKGVI